ncbi:DUF1382 family protein [Xanthomonas arboricola]|uniref:DUF1382 family protein n=1 Tax=Xanthomonas arboricola TaxID=56448 RepID=UPI001430D3F5|nr:DUF1382 family protein [Xanthomonas arboricola]NJB80315.1 hypothetical protein [Xanthomonas arboricola]
MNRANVVELRRAIQTAQDLTRAGVLFVPMPVLDRDDHVALAQQAADRLLKMEREASEDAE